jgi:hypothetical protein
VALDVFRLFVVDACHGISGFPSGKGRLFWCVRMRESAG